MKLSDIVGQPAGLAAEITEKHLERQRLMDRAFGLNSAAMRIHDEICRMEELSGLAEMRRLTALLPENPSRRLADIVGRDPFEDALKTTRALSEPFEATNAAQARAATENLFSASLSDSVFKVAGRPMIDELSAAVAGISGALGRAFPSALDDLAGVRSIAAGLAQTLEAGRSVDGLAQAAGTRSELDRALGTIESAMPRGLAEAMRALETDSFTKSLLWLERDRIGIGREIFEAATVNEWLEAIPDALDEESDFWGEIWERSKEISAKYGKPAQTLFLTIVAQIITKILWTYLIHPAIENAIERYSAAAPEAPVIERSEESAQEAESPQSGPPL